MCRSFTLGRLQSCPVTAPSAGVAIGTTIRKDEKSVITARFRSRLPVVQALGEIKHQVLRRIEKDLMKFLLSPALMLATTLTVGCVSAPPEYAGKSVPEMIKALPDPDSPPKTTLEAKKAAAQDLLAMSTIVYAEMGTNGVPVTTEVDLRAGRLVSYYSWSLCYSGYFPFTSRIDDNGNVELYVHVVKTKSTASSALLAECGDFTVTINPENRGAKSSRMVNTKEPRGPFKRMVVSIQ